MVNNLVIFSKINAASLRFAAFIYSFLLTIYTRFFTHPVSVLYKLSFWDSLIIVSAESSKCISLLTEDLNSSQVIKGVTVVNPFV